MNMDKWLSTLTVAGLVGLFVLNPDGANSLIKSLSGAATSYVSTVQGR